MNIRSFGVNEALSERLALDHPPALGFLDRSVFLRAKNPNANSGQAGWNPRLGYVDRLLVFQYLHQVPEAPDGVHQIHWGHRQAFLRTPPA